MEDYNRTEYVTRDTILRLLSDDEIARVSTEETAMRLQSGEEYVDLQAPDQGVLIALPGTPAPMGRLLARKAVQEHTWREIVILLDAHHDEGIAPRTMGA